MMLMMTTIHDDDDDDNDEDNDVVDDYSFISDHSENNIVYSNTDLIIIWLSAQQ